MGCIWFDVCWCYVAVWLWWCGIRMQAEALVLQPAYGYHTKVLVFRRVRKVAKNVYYSRHVCLSVCLSVCLHVWPRVSAGLPPGRFPWNLTLRAVMTICGEKSNWVKIRQNIGHIACRPKDVSLLPTTVNRHYSALFHWNCSRLLFCLSVCPQVSTRLPLRITMKFDRGGAFIKSIHKLRICFKSGKNIWHSKWRHKYVLLLLATLNHHKPALFVWNAIRQLGQPRRYKH